MLNKYYISNNIRFVQGIGNLMETPSSATHMKYNEAANYISSHSGFTIMKHGNNKKGKNYVVSTKQVYIGMDSDFVEDVNAAKSFNSPEAAFIYLNTIRPKYTEPLYVIRDDYKKMSQPEKLPKPPVVKQDNAPLQRDIITATSKRIVFSKRTRQYFVDKTRVCAICGMPISDDDGTVDHIMPLSRGGTNAVNNLRLIHRRCNSIKGDATDEEMLNSITRIACNNISAINKDMLIRSIVRETLKEAGYDIK